MIYLMKLGTVAIAAIAIALAVGVFMAGLPLPQAHAGFGRNIGYGRGIGFGHNIVGGPYDNLNLNPQIVFVGFGIYR